MSEVLLQNNKDGGVTLAIYGSKGAGKTTFLLTLAERISCISPFDKGIENQTIIWRGRYTDYWNWLPKENVTLFIHRDDIDRIKFKNDMLEDLDKADLPRIVKYTSIKSLYDNLVKGKINVVYEPTTYTLTENIRKMIQRRGVVGDELFKDPRVDPVIFWFELFDWLVRNKSLDFITIIFDEAGELFPTAPAGARWHLNLWARDKMGDFRKRNLSLILACHGYQDIDGRILTKLMYRIYMKGCTTPVTSLINRHAPILLERGMFYIESNAWGMARFSKIEEQPRVLVDFDEIPEPEPDPEDTGVGGGGDDDNGGKRGKKKTKKGRVIAPSEEIVINDKVKVDKTGTLVIDVRGLPEDAVTVEGLAEALRPPAPVSAPVSAPTPEPPSKFTFVNEMKEVKRLMGIGDYATIRNKYPKWYANIKKQAEEKGKTLPRSFIEADSAPDSTLIEKEIKSSNVENKDKATVASVKKQSGNTTSVIVNKEIKKPRDTSNDVYRK